MLSVGSLRALENDMGIVVYKVFVIRDNWLVEATDLPKRCAFRAGDIASFLVSAKEESADGPGWTLSVEVVEGGTRRRIGLPLGPVLSAEDQGRSSTEPVSLTRTQSDREPGHDWIWLFRDALYVTERVPFESERDEIVLRIKALHFQGDEKLRRLREQVANFEAIAQSAAQGRKAIPDDVKLLVWSRDGGACVRCGSSKELHFDHIIPLVKGGGDHAENIQLLCRGCNLSKGGRLS